MLNQIAYYEYMQNVENKHVLGFVLGCTDAF